jgi:hypothetical protein
MKTKVVEVKDQALTGARRWLVALSLADGVAKRAGP